MMIREKLEKLYDIGSSKRVFQSEWRSEGVPFYRAREIAKLAIDDYVDNELFIDEELYDSYVEKYGKPQPGDIMVTGVGTLGVCYIVKPDDKFYFKDGNILWFKQKAPDRILPEYLVKLFDSNDVREFISRNSSGTTVGTFTIQTAKKLEINLPSLGEQKRIIQKLAKIENIINNRKRELVLLDDCIKARFVELYNTSFLGEETTIEAITERVKVGFVGTCEKYYTSNSGIPMLRTGNITNNGINLSDLKYVTNDFHEKNKKSQILEGDILIARHGSNGQANVYYGPEAQCLNAVVIVPNNEIATSVFLAGLINSPMVKEQIVRTLVGSTQHVVNTKSIAGLVVRIPNLEVQKEYEDFVNQIDKSKVVVPSKIKNAIFVIMLSVSFGQITSI
jgi:type I restriction enzyme S subunit